MDIKIYLKGYILMKKTQLSLKSVQYNMQIFIKMGVEEIKSTYDSCDNQVNFSFFNYRIIFIKIKTKLWRKLKPTKPRRCITFAVII